MTNNSLKIKGVLEDQTAIVGSLSSDGIDRPVIVILNTAQTDYKKRKAIQLAKDSAQISYIPLAGEIEQGLTAVFKTQATNDIIGRIHDPHEVYPTLDTILEQSDEGLIVLDCYNKSSFWTTLKALDVSNEDMFPLAELEAFKQNGSTVNSKKPIVKAHELLHSLSFPTKFFGKSTLHYLQRVRSAVKVKAPSICLQDQIILASYNRDIQLNNGEGDTHDQRVFNSLKRGAKINVAFKSLFNRSVGKVAAVAGKVKPYATKLNWRAKHGDVSDHKHSVLNGTELLEPLMIFEGDTEEIVDRYYRERWGIQDLDRITQLEPVLSAELVALTKAQFRDGNHRPPYDNMLIECEITSGVESHDHQQDYFVLLRLDKDNVFGEDTVNVNVFANTQRDDGSEAHFIHSEEFTFNLNEDGSLRSIHSYCRRKEEEQTLAMFNGTYLSMAISQALNIIARMNEPDFVEHKVKPQRGVKAHKKGHFPYFEAIDIQNFSPASRYVSFDTNGRVGNGVALHPVKRHQRRIFDKQTGALKEVVTVKAHLRGSAAVGVRARTHDFSQN